MSTILDTNQLARAAVIVERQLWQEMALLDRLEAVNERLGGILDRPGPGSLTEPEIKALQAAWEEAAEMMKNIHARQENVVKEIEAATGERMRLSKFVQQLQEPRRGSLKQLRTKLLARLQAAFGKLLGNHATLFYLFEYHRNLISGLIEFDTQDNQYSESGRGKLISSGTLLHKAV